MVAHPVRRMRSKRMPSNEAFALFFRHKSEVLIAARRLDTP
jgi:hypothetical protein